MLPGLYLGVGGLLGLVQLRWRWLAWLLLALLLAAQYPLLQRNLAERKTDYRTAAAFVFARLHAGDPVLVRTEIDTLAIRYYLPALFGRPVSGSYSERIYFVNTANAPDLCRKMTDVARFGVMTDAFTPDPIKALRDACGANYDIESITTFNYLGQVWRHKPSASATQTLPTGPVS
jgi:hypothetical protein